MLNKQTEVEKKRVKQRNFQENSRFTREQYHSGNALAL